MSKLQLFLKLGNYNNISKTSRIVFTTEFVNEFAGLRLGNGGSWCRYSNANKYKIVTMKNNGKFNFLWNVTEDEKLTIKREFSHIETSKGMFIKCIKIVGEKETELKRPIRSDIKRFYKNKACCACGKTSEIVCDHKNDLYNDPRVLNIKTQTLEDFQSLCNSCNLQKRQICKKTKETQERYSATNIPSLKVFGKKFTKGDETLNIKDPDAMKGTYWYDPVDFMTKVFQELSLYNQN